jgi:thiamine biosynthesis lipoprotein
MSFHDSDSDLSRINREALHHAVTVDHWTYEVLLAAQQCAEASNGAFDPTIARELQDWGLLPTEHDNLRANETGDWRDIQLLGHCEVRFRRPVRLDLGGIAKGFAVDRAIDALKAAGIRQGSVNAGGDLRVFGEESMIVQIRDPRTGGRHVHSIELRDAALATSAPTFSLQSVRQRTVSHLVNPLTRRAFVRSISVTVRASDCMTADALTKVALFGGTRTRNLLEANGAEAFVLAEAGGAEP